MDFRNIKFGLGRTDFKTGKFRLLRNEFPAFRVIGGAGSIPLEFSMAFHLHVPFT